MKKNKTRLIVYLLPGFMAVAFTVMILSMVTDWFSFTDRCRRLCGVTL